MLNSTSQGKEKNHPMNQMVDSCSWSSKGALARSGLIPRKEGRLGLLLVLPPSFLSSVCSPHRCKFDVLNVYYPVLGSRNDDAAKIERRNDWDRHMLRFLQERTKPLVGR